MSAREPGTDPIHVARPPWTDRQVSHLWAWQNADHIHSMTCGGEHGGRRVELVPTPDGWFCPTGCGYRQDWAYRWQVDGLPPPNLNRPPDDFN